MGNGFRTEPPVILIDALIFFLKFIWLAVFKKSNTLSRTVCAIRKRGSHNKNL